MSDAELLTMHLRGEAKSENLEWKYIVQMRFRVGTAQSETDRVADGDLFELGKRCPPIAIRIADSNIQRIRIEMKFVETVSYTFLKTC
ncbi:unnamed protein product [Gongylonema pulchrum]|uniref:Uncharacterized protein n=1 Tax=Gongylonema pulchrum TaxID=637853 RepID=A0A183EJU2_9BILA|nr:unnamed protein product [Gongylonema pulchrum]